MQSARKTQFIWLIKAKLYIEIFIPIWRERCIPFMRQRLHKRILFRSFLFCFLTRVQVTTAIKKRVAYVLRK